MKTLLTVVCILFYLLPFAQNTTTDTSATCIAYWRKGEHKTFRITKSKENQPEKKPKSQSQFTYEAHVQVLDSTAEGYTLQWQFKNFGAKDDPAADLAGAVMEKLKIHYTTTSTGAFKDLTNWKEVRDFYISMMELSFDRPQDDTAQAIKKQVLSLFQTKEQVEALLIREVQLYHTPFGFEYTKGERRTETTLDNLFGGAPLPAIQTLIVPQIAPAQNTFILLIETQLDKGSLTQVGMDVLKKLLPFPVASEQEMKEAFAALQTKVNSEFHVTLSTGWLSKVRYQKEVQSGSSFQLETYLIEEL
jgi:hypothetical protein